MEENEQGKIDQIDFKIQVKKKTWSKIGPRFQHTNERLKELKILKIEDELKILESKLIWRWGKNKLPLGIQNLINEKNNQTLRNRQFLRSNSWKQDSIAYRLATRAIKEIKEIEIERQTKRTSKKI